jgi:hypothetical protein
MPVSVNRLEKVVRVPPAVAVDRRPKKLPIVLTTAWTNGFDDPYYAFVVLPPIPTGTVTVAVSPVAEVTKEVSDTGALLEPLYKRS